MNNIRIIMNIIIHDENILNYKFVPKQQRAFQSKLESQEGIRVIGLKQNLSVSILFFINVQRIDVACT